MANRAPSKSALIYALNVLANHIRDSREEGDPLPECVRHAEHLYYETRDAPYQEDVYDTVQLENAGFQVKDHHWFVHASNKCAIAMPHGDDDFVNEKYQDSRWEAHAGNLTGKEDTRVGTYDTLQEALDHCLRILSE